jgi:hypothetical protein
VDRVGDRLCAASALLHELLDLGGAAVVADDVVTDLPHDARGQAKDSPPGEPDDDTRPLVDVRAHVLTDDLDVGIGGGARGTECDSVRRTVMHVPGLHLRRRHR